MTEKDKGMTEDFGSSIEMQRDFDIVEELEKTLDEIDKAFEIAETDSVPDKISYFRFLIRDLDNALSGEHEKLRLRSFVIKRPR